jgi:hypothetical protein
MCSAASYRNRLSHDLHTGFLQTCSAHTSSLLPKIEKSHNYFYGHTFLEKI